MNLNYAEAFYYSIKLHGISNAAKFLYTSHSTLSMKIKKLENELRTTLVIREKNRIDMTSDGEKLYQLLEEMIKDFEDFEMYQDKTFALLVGTSVVNTTFITQLLYNQLVSHFWEIRMEYADHFDLVKRLENSQLDVIVSRNYIEDKRFFRVQLSEVGVYLVLPQGLNLEKNVEVVLILSQLEEHTEARIKEFLNSHNIQWSGDFRRVVDFHKYFTCLQIENAIYVIGDIYLELISEYIKIEERHRISTINAYIYGLETSKELKNMLQNSIKTRYEDESK